MSKYGKLRRIWDSIDWGCLGEALFVIGLTVVCSIPIFILAVIVGYMMAGGHG